MKSSHTILLTLPVLALTLACGPKDSPAPAVPDTPSQTAAAAEPAQEPAPAPQLVDAWYKDHDGDGVPDFVELELHRDPNIDECIVEACGEKAKPGRLVSAINTLIVIDASGSMKGRIPGTKETKLDLAKKAVLRYVDAMPDVELMKVGVMVYGHEGDSSEASKEKSCQSFSTLRPLGAVKPKEVAAAVKPIKAAGWSPIAGALEAAAKVMPEEVGVMNRVILVADGIEACGGDPVAMARHLKDTNRLTTVDVVGFDFGTAQDDTMLRAIAAATEGTYQEASTVAEFNDAFNTLSWNLWQTFETWMCAVGSPPLMACYNERAGEAIARTEKEIEAMASREKGGEKYTADLKAIQARTEAMRDGRSRVVTTFQVKLEEFRAASAKRRPKAG